MVSAVAARITQRGSFHKVQCLVSGRYVRFPRNPHAPVRLTSADLCTWFPSYALAVDTVCARLGACAVEIERHDA